MADPKDNLLDWLRDAHAMEQQAEQMLKGQASRLEHYPKLKARIEQHITETQQQRELLEGCISRLGGSPSMLKDLAGKAMASDRPWAAWCSRTKWSRAPWPVTSSRTWKSPPTQC